MRSNVQHPWLLHSQQMLLCRRVIGERLALNTRLRENSRYRLTLGLGTLQACQVACKSAPRIACKNAPELRPIFKAIRVVSCFNNIAVMNQSIEQSRSQFIVSKQRTPFRESQVCSHNDAGILMQLTDEMKQQ